jgi:hypothetical protein
MARRSFRNDDYEPDYDDYDRGPCFADPGGNSALRAATKGNPRNRSCPTCKRRRMLTPADVALGYQCDYCANKTERGLAWDE